MYDEDDIVVRRPRNNLGASYSVKKQLTQEELLQELRERRLQKWMLKANTAPAPAKTYKVSPCIWRKEVLNCWIVKLERTVQRDGEKVKFRFFPDDKFESLEEAVKARDEFLLKNGLVLSPTCSDQDRIIFKKVPKSKVPPKPKMHRVGGGELVFQKLGLKLNASKVAALLSQMEASKRDAPSYADI